MSSVGYRQALRNADREELERHFAFQLDALGIPYDREVRLVRGRNFRYDFVFCAAQLVVEVDGGTWSGGRHTRGAGFAQDCEKAALARIHGGWCTLHVTADQVKDGRAAKWVEEIVKS